MHVFKQSPMQVSEESQEELETVIVEPVSKADIQGTMLADTSFSAEPRVYLGIPFTRVTVNLD